MKKGVLFLASVFVLLWAVTSDARVQFEVTCIRGTGEPVTETFTFTAFGGPATVKLWNGGLEDSDAENVSSSTVAVNGEVIFGPSNFNQNVDFLEEETTLVEGQNTLEVLLKAKPGGQVTIQIIQNVPPEIRITNPLDNSTITSSTPYITIEFSDEDLDVDPSSLTVQINGIDCTSSFDVTDTGATYQVPESSKLPVGDNTLFASIQDRVGNEASARSNFSIEILKAIPGAHPTSGCVPLTVYFTTDGEDPDHTIEVYRWDFEGDGVWDTSDRMATDYTHTYTAAGTYHAQLQVENNVGDTATAEVIITVTGSPPQAWADAVPSNGAVPLTVTFTGHGKKTGGAIVLHEYDFEGDGIFDYTTDTFTGGPQPDSITFFINHAACNSGTFNFYLNGVLIDSDTTREGCYCNSSEHAYTISDPSVLSNWDTTVNNILRVDAAGEVYVGYIRVVLTTGATTDEHCMFDAVAGGACGNRDLCNGHRYGTATYTLALDDPITTSTAQYTYQSEGTYNAVFRVTDDEDMTATASPVVTAVRVGPPGSPTAIGTAEPTEGQGPLTVHFTHDGTDPDGSIVLYEWDFEGDGVYEYSLGTDGAVDHTYTDGGRYVARLRVTDNEGLTGVDLFEITVTTDATLRIGDSDYTVNPNAGESIDVITTFSGSVNDLSILIKNREGATVCTLVDVSARSGGTYTDPWDGKDNSDLIVNDGVYYAVAKYSDGLGSHVIDLTFTTGGERYTQSYQGWSGTNWAYPFSDQFAPIQFSLGRASEVTLFIGYLWYADQRIRTVYNRLALPAGSHTACWDGLADDGSIIHAPSGDMLIPGFWRYNLPENAIYVTGGKPVVSNVMADPNYFSPFSEKCGPDGEGAGIIVGFDVSEDVQSVSLNIYSVSSGSLLRTITLEDVLAGNHAIFWDGKNNGGEYVDIDDYQVGVIATDSQGNDSMLKYTLVRIDL